MTLYDYVKELDEIILKATNEEGEIEADVIAELDALEMEISEKVDNCIKYFKSRKAMAEALKREKIAISDRQRVAENEAQRMKEYLTFCLNGEKWESVAGKISYRKSKAVEIDDMQLIPEEFLRYEIKPDKTELKKMLEQGEDVSGCHLEENTSTIIK